MENTPALSTSDMTTASQDVLTYQGRSYIKLLALRSNVLFQEGATKRRATLWLCTELQQKFPARTLVLPEFIT